jgi:chain length determinant protein EpsF
MSFPQFLAILRARWQIVLGIFAICTMAALAISLRSPELYTAIASVVVDAKHDPLAGAYPGPLLADEMQTQTDIVTSQRVAERVVKSLRLDQDPALKQAWQKSTGGRGDFIGWLAGSLQESITVPPPRESTVINISVRWSNAKDAAKIANAFAQAYIDTNIELKVQPAKQYAKWFDERSRALRADLEAKQKLLSDYRDKEGLIAVDEHVDIEMARLAELSSQLVAIQSQREDSQSREQQASPNGNRAGGDNDAVPEILQSPLIAGLKSQLSQTEAKERLLATQVGDNHPDYQRVEAEISSLRDRISRETAKVITSLRNTTRVNMRREKALVDAIAAQKKHLVELKHQTDHAAILQSDVVTAQRNFDVVSQSLAQTSLESQARQANVALLTRATEPAVRSSPKYSLNLAAGVFLGIALGIGAALWLESLHPRVRRHAGLAKLLGVPLLARISSTPPARPGVTTRFTLGPIASRALGRPT